MKVLEKEKGSISQEKNVKKIQQNNNDELKSKRDISIDLIRVIACLTVIGTHLCLQVLNQCYNRIDWSRLLEKSFLTDGVPLFFMITGFFLVNGRSYKKIWKSTALKILLPSFLFVLFTQVFYPFIVNQESFMWCIKNFNINALGILESILKADVTYLNPTCAHLWYIYSYVKIVIWIPVLWLVCKGTKESKLARRIMIGLSILKIVLGDIQRFITIPNIGAINILSLIPTEILYVLLGYELFAHKDKIKNNKKLCIISLIGYVGINLLRYKIEMQYMVLNYLTDIVGRENFMEWKYTSINIISGLFLFMFLYSFEIKNKKLSNIILWISNRTFGIYLVHYLILAKVDLYKFEKIEKFIFELAYLAIGLIFTLILSIVIVVILENIKKFIVRLFKLLKMKLLVENK